MIPSRHILPTLLVVALASACDSSGGKEAAPAKADAKEAKTDAKTNVSAEGKGPANPHAANPHAGMPPMMGAPPTPKGPPRDITPSGQTAAETLPDLTFAVPSEWEKGTPTNSMRVAQWVLPGPGGDAELVVFRFPGGGGGIEQNVARWKGQFQPPEGKTIDDVTVTKTIEGTGVKTTLLDVSGTFVAAVMPGAEEKHDDADQRMLAAIVEGAGDPFYFKAVGPRVTMDLWAPAFDTMAKGFAAAGGGTVPPGVGPAPAPGEAKADDAASGDAKAEGKGDAKGEAKADTTKAGG